MTFFGDSRSVLILIFYSSQNNKRIVNDETFALLFTANDVYDVTD